MTMTTTDTPEAEALRVSIQREMLKQDGSSPAVVTNVSTSGATVDAQPAISKTQRLEGVTTELPRSEVRGAPVMMYGSTSKGIFVCPPISPGDDGVLIPMMRALDNWQHGQGVGPPPDMQTPRSGDLSDGAYYPGILRESVEIANYPTDALTIQTADASTVFSLKAGEIKLTVGAMSVTLDATGLHINAPVDITGIVAITGNLGQMGNQTINGTVTANQFITVP